MSDDIAAALQTAWGDGYIRGAQNERWLIVEWLRSRAALGILPLDLADAIDRGKHVGGDDG